MTFKKNIFFTLFPVGYWITMAVGVVFHFQPGVSLLGNVLINLSAFFVSLKLAVIIHEAGHLLAAKVVGGTPRRVVLGKGHELYRTRIFNIRVVINSNFLGGYAYASFEKPGLLKFRYGVFTLGGVLLNTIFAFLVYVFFEMDFSDPTGEILVNIPYAIFLANASMLLNLIPFYTTILGRKVATDGMALLKLPFTKLGEIEKTIDMNLLWDGYEFLEQKDYASAWRVYHEYHSRHPETKILSLNFSLILIKTGKTEEGLAESLKLLDHLEDKEVKAYAALIYNQIAWIYLVLNDIPQADHFSALAIKALPNENYARGTRASVLIERGLRNEGINLLHGNMDFKFVNNITLSAAIYLMTAYHLQGDVNESKRYFQFIETNKARLECDEKILYDRCLEKIELKEIALS